MYSWNNAFLIYGSLNVIDCLENLNELTSLQSQVKVLRLKVKQGKKNFHEGTKNIF